MTYAMGVGISFRARLMAGLALAVLAGCGDPLQGVPRLSDVDMPDAPAAAQISVPDDEDAAREAIVATTQTGATETAPRRGLLGLFQRRAEAAKTETDPAAPAPQDDTQEAALAPQPADARGGAATGGFFGRLLGGGSGGGAGAPMPGAPDYDQVGPGTTLPYGRIARLCGVPADRLGRESARYPERGRGYVIYDSAPGSTAPRSFFVTGFDDGCARQFTAALALFGEPELHEQLRYGLPSETHPYSETDAAYERVKARICGVRDGQPCGSRIDRLSQNTVFVSIYERFVGSPVWKNILLHDGEVVALDIKGR